MTERQQKKLLIKNREFDVFKPQKYKYLLGTPCGVLCRFCKNAEKARIIAVFMTFAQS